jgi:GTPase
LRFLRHIERNSLLLFMIPIDDDDIVKTYGILLNELAKFNPEMLDKHRVLAITKCDTVDSELIAMLGTNIPDVPHVFISGVSGMGLSELKDILWKELNNESNKLEPQIATENLVHRSKDVADLNRELLEAGEDFEYEYEDIEEDDIDIEESYEDDLDQDSER